MRFARLSSGHHLAEADTPHGRFRVEWDARGNLVSEWIEIREPQTRANTPCQHRGDDIERVACPTCSGSVKVVVFGCALHQRCTIQKPVEGAGCCGTCRDYTP